MGMNRTSPPSYTVGGVSGRSSTRPVEPPIAPTNGSRFNTDDAIRAYGQGPVAPGRPALPVNPVCTANGPVPVMPTAEMPQAK
jgi:hypothetical protein